MPSLDPRGSPLRGPVRTWEIDRAARCLPASLASLLALGQSSRSCAASVAALLGFVFRGRERLRSERFHRADRPCQIGRSAIAMTSCRCSPRPAATGSLPRQLNGKGGFRLSLRGDDPDFDFRSMTREPARPARQPRRTRSEPGRAQADRPVPHEGGIASRPVRDEAATCSTGSPPGPRDDLATAPRLKSLQVCPAERSSRSSAHDRAACSSRPSSPTARPAT